MSADLNPGTAEMVTHPGAKSSVDSRNSTMLGSAEGKELSTPTNSNNIIIILSLLLSPVL